MDLELDELRLRGTQTIMRALDEWGLNSEQIIVLLRFGGSGIRSRHLNKFRTETAFPDGDSVTRRMLELLAIIDALGTSFPRNIEARAQWMNTPHRRMRRRTPLHTMLEDGDNGVIAVRAELDCVYAWELSGSTL